ncbi:MAG: hypothetical protein ACHQCH_00090 [Solirubrobacterales bacterium]
MLVLLLACLGLAACGSSSGSSSSTTSASASSTTTTGATGAKGPNAGRFAAIRACLSKSGITLPQRPKPGQRRSFGQGIPGLHLPKGMTRAQYQAIVKKCGFGIGPRGLAGGGLLGSAAAKQALAKFASCMRESGVNIPAPNTSGSGPVFSSKGLNTRSPKFQAAEIKCRGLLRSVLRARPGAGGKAPPAG